MIIMLQWLRLYTLGSRGSREHKTFLETRLISSRVDQKFKNKRGKYMGFKEEIRLEIVDDGGDLGASVAASWVRFRGQGSWLQCRDGLVMTKASILLPHRRNFRHDQATIAPRSGRDRATIVVLNLRRSHADRLELTPQRETCDCGSIAPRSRLDRAAVAEFFHESSRQSDMTIVTWWRSDAPERSTRLQRRPSDRDRAISLWWQSDALRVATWRQVSRSIISLTPRIQHVVDLVIAWTEVHAISAAVIRSNARRASTWPAKENRVGT